jgi:hypothetical protein
VDQVTPAGRGKFAAARIRSAAFEAGIGPNDSLAPLIDALAALPEDCEGVFSGLSGDLRQVLAEAEKHAGGELTRQATAELPPALDRFVANRAREWFITAAVAGTLALAILLGGAWLLSAYNYSRGYYAGMAATTNAVKASEGALWSKVSALTPDQAGVWSALMALNPDPRGAISNCPTEDGRTFCWFKLWTESAKPPSAKHAAND